MARKPRELTEDELVVWRRVARTARPLPGRSVPPEPEPESASPPAAKTGTRAPTATAAPAGAPAGVKPRGPAAPDEIGGEKRVRRGKLEIDASIDLHGMTLAQAQDALSRFVRRQRAQGARIVLVVTGKGRGGEGLIRAAAPEWLGMEAAHVSGYAPAHQRHGGAGALYVRLRRLERAD